MPVINGMTGVHEMEFWMNLMFGNSVGLMSMLVIIGTFLLILVLTMLVTALHLHVKRWLQLDWRRWMTTRLLDQWMAHARHYQLQFTSDFNVQPMGWLHLHTAKVSSV